MHCSKNSLLNEEFNIAQTATLVKNYKVTLQCFTMRTQILKKVDVEQAI